MDWKELGLTRTTQLLNIFVKRRGAWASANQPLATRRTNAREEALHIYMARIFERVREKERCMGKPESTHSHNMNERTRGRLTHIRYEYSYMFVKRRGAWASPNQP